MQGTQLDEGNSLYDSVNGKATLMTSRRSLLAGSKLLAGAGLALGLSLTGYISPANAGPPPPPPLPVAAHHHLLLRVAARHHPLLVEVRTASCRGL